MDNLRVQHTIPSRGYHYDEEREFKSLIHELIDNTPVFELMKLFEIRSYQSASRQYYYDESVTFQCTYHPNLFRLDRLIKEDDDRKRIERISTQLLLEKSVK